MKVKLTYKRLIHKLQKINFVVKRMLGSHVIMYNSEYNSSIVLPSAKSTEIVAEYFLRFIKKNLIEKGIVTEEQFIKLMTEGD